MQALLKKLRDGRCRNLCKEIRSFHSLLQGLQVRLTLQMSGGDSFGILPTLFSRRRNREWIQGAIGNISVDYKVISVTEVMAIVRGLKLQGSWKI